MGAVQAAEKLVTLKSGRTRVFRSKQERRQIVEETLKPGASVALVARAHGVNANQVFAWRRTFRKGGLETVASAALLPVKISDAITVPAQRREKSKPIRRGIIDIDLGHARVRIEGVADPECVRAALQSLLR
jgi:transposase